MSTAPSWAWPLRTWLSSQRPWIRPRSSEQCHWHHPEGVRLAPNRYAPHVLARALCRCRYLPYHSLPERERLEAVRVQLRMWAPFAQPDYALVRDPEGVLVIAWDAQAFQERCMTAGLPTQAAPLIPESLLGPRHQEGVSCRWCDPGVEGRVWRQGRLVSSRWWPQPPERAEWLNFQRGAGLPPELQSRAPPDEASCDSDDRPWTEAERLSELLERPRLRLHAALALGLWCLILPTVWLGAQLLSLRQAASTLNAEAHRTEQEARPLLRARDEALNELASLDYLLAQVRHPTPLSLLAHLSRQLPDGSRVLELEWENRRLRLVLEPAPDTSRATYVKALEDGGRLRNVREISQDRGQEGLALAADLDS